MGIHHDRGRPHRRSAAADEPRQQWCSPGRFGPAGIWSRRPRARGPLRRSSEDRLLGGVAACLAARTGLDVTVVRVGLILFGLASGVGVAAYVAAWLLVPADDEPTSIGARAARDRRGLALAAALAPALLLTVFMASLLKAGWLASLAWPTSASTAGLVLVWRNGSEAERGLLRRAAASVVQLGSGNNHRASRHPHAGVVARLGAGLVLIGAGAGLLSVGHRSPLYTPVGGVALVLAGFVVLFGPWWLGIARDLVLERQARVRAEEARTWPPECTTRSFRPWP